MNLLLLRFLDASDKRAPHAELTASKSAKARSRGQVDLETAQRAIAANWTEAYQTFMGASPSVAVSREPLVAPNATGSQSRSKANAPNAAENEVWVNTRSGVYWKLGSAFHGKTKQGTFMTEADAVAAGYRPARGRGY